MSLQSQHPGAPRARVIRALSLISILAWLACVAVPSVLAAPQQPEPAKPAAVSEPPAHTPDAPAAQEAPAKAEAAAPEHGKEPAEHAKEAAAEHGGEGEGEHSESPWAVVARIVNFAILAGALVYLLRSPLMGYLEQRGVAVRSELTKAAELKQDASAQIQRIDAKMQALPSEIEALKQRGAEETAAEETRIRAQAETERKRLLDQAKRDIDTQVRIAERDLKKRAGELAVGLATDRVRREITDRDQARLVDKYVSQVRH